MSRQAARVTLLVLIALFPVHHGLYNASANASSAPTNGIYPGPEPVLTTPEDLPEDTEIDDGPGVATTEDNEPIGALSLLQEDLNDSGSPLDDTPDWAIGKGEQPAGVQNMKGGWKMRVFTPDQQHRLGVNKFGEHKHGAIGLGENSATKMHEGEDESEESTSSDDPRHDDKTLSEHDASNDDSAARGDDDDDDDVALPDDDPWPWK